MKKFAAFIIDLVFYLSLLFITLVIAVVVIYNKEQDISLINTLLQTQLTPTLLYTYGAIALLAILYFTILATLLGGTVGQRLFHYELLPKNKRNILSVFMFTVAGAFWKLILFPYSIYLAITKKPQVDSKLSQLELSTVSEKLSIPVIIATAVFTLSLVATVGIGTYVYRTGIGTLMEKYTDYRKQTADLIDKQAFQDASVTLEKYKQYHGETPIYSFYKCEIVANLTTDESNLAICQKAAEQNAGNGEYIPTILLLEARTLAANDNYVEAEKKYADVWNTYGVRTIDMKDYVVVLSELGKSTEASTVLTEVAKNINPSDSLSMLDIATLYERVGNLDLALSTYQSIMDGIPTGTNVELVGELNYHIGVIQYKKGKYADAQKSFETAKTLNKDFAEPADSYIILISKLGKSVTK